MRRNYLRPGKEPPERIGRPGAQLSRRAGNSACSHQPDWKPSRSMEPLDIVPKGLTLVVGNN